MGFFGKKKGGGGAIADVIRCDEDEYLVWKWRPKGAEGGGGRENAIRFGSSLRVKDGEVAVFVYKQKDGTNQDFIMGPFDETLKTANLPIISSILGAGFDGESPFQAEVYFMNLAGINQVKFGIPYFDVYDPRFLDFGVPMACRGSITFNLTDYKAFIKLHRLIEFDLTDFSKQIKDAVTRKVKSVVANAPADHGMPVVQMERKIDEINDILKPKIQEILEGDFGVNLKRFDLANIEPDKESEGWKELRSVTADLAKNSAVANNKLEIKNAADMQQIQAQHMKGTLDIQRQESQRAQMLSTQTQFAGTHQMNLQADVAKAAAESMGEMGAGGGAGGINPGAMMAGMAMGSAVGGHMAQQVGGMMAGMNQPVAPGMTAPVAPGMPQAPPPPNMQAPPPPAAPAAPQIQLQVMVGGQQQGPFGMPQLQQMVAAGQITADTMVWGPGMAAWQAAGTVPALAAFFAPPPPPPG